MMGRFVAFAWCGCFMLISGGIAAAEEWKPLFEGIEVLATPSNGEAPGETDGWKTSTE